MVERPEETSPGAHASRPLADLVRAEAIRAGAEARIRPDPARLAQGFAFRFAIEAGRAADLVGLYEASGFEVAVDPVLAHQVGEECADCRLLLQSTYVAIYTRPRGGSRAAPAGRGGTPVP